MSKRLSIKNITLAVFLAASLNLAWQFYRMHRESVERQIAYEQSGLTLCSFGPSRDEFSRIYIEFFLMVAFVGCRVKGFKNTLLSVVGFAGATIFYVLWWQHYFRLALIAEYPNYIRHLAFLYRANYLDLCIAGAIGVLILLHVRREVLSLFRPTSVCS